MPSRKGIPYVYIGKRKGRNKWYISYRERPGDNPTIEVVSASYELTRRKATQVSQRIDRLRNDLFTPEDLRHLDAVARVLAAGPAEKWTGPAGEYHPGHLEDYRDHMRSTDGTGKQADEVYSRCLTVVRWCGFTRVDQIEGDVVQGAVSDLKGERKWAPKTANDYLKSMHQFVRWLRRPPARLRGPDPLEFLKLYRTAGMETHVRRALEADELRWLLTTTRGGEPYQGIPGAERYMTYFGAVHTGLRKSELASLRPESFALDGETPIVTVRAGDSKHRKTDEQPLRRDVAASLKPWLATKRRGRPVFAVPDKAFLMIKSDLAAARAAWLAAAPNDRERRRLEASNFLRYVDDQGRVADFHALRHTFGTLLGERGVDLAEIQELMRHGDIRLTRRYRHTRLRNVVAALDALPEIPPDEGDAHPHAAQATGTYGPEPRTSDGAGQSPAQSMEFPTAAHLSTNRLSSLAGSSGIDAPQLSGRPAVCGRIGVPPGVGLRNRRLQVRVLQAALPQVLPAGEVTAGPPDGAAADADAPAVAGAVSPPAAPAPLDLEAARRFCEQFLASLPPRSETPEGGHDGR